MAHAIFGYQGACKNIHGHSYELHTTFQSTSHQTGIIPAPGFLLDFKDIKRMVQETVIIELDHRIVLSEAFVSENAFIKQTENLVIWPMEPTAENILYFIQQTLAKVLPEDVNLVYLKLYETKDSFAEWFL
jgi:6-pyruvoyltetrahydropterin/6-carboxytetrahydropterin synthase